MNQNELRKQQLNNALESMSEWLSDEYELGKAPYTTQLAEEFERYGMRYFILKYQETAESEWLLGVCGGYEGDETEHCGHVFSEMELYDPNTAQEKAIAMVDMIREYWMQRAKEEEEGTGCHCEYEEAEEGGDDQADKEDRKNDEDSGPEVGMFSGFVLLKDCEWNVSQLKQDLKNDWGLTCEVQSSEQKSEQKSEQNSNLHNETLESKETIIFDVEGMTVACSLIPVPVPGEEAELNAANNYTWPQALAVTKQHQAHLIVAVLKHEQSAIEAGQAFVKVCCACLKQNNALGLYTSGTVFQPEFYREAAEVIKKGGLPVLNWIHFGLYQTEEGMNGYTCGLRDFGKYELEVLNSKAQPQELREFLFDITYYILDEDVTLKDGETIGFSVNQKLAITFSEGIATAGNSIKIAY